MGITPGTPNIPAAGAGPDDELQILLSDYTSLRDDERNTLATQGVAVSIAIVLLGGLVAFAGQSCILSANHKNCTDVPTAFLATAPSIPFAALGFVILQGVISVLRSYYMRLVELELQARAPIKFKQFSTLGPASFIGLTTEITSLRRGRWSYQALVGLIIFITTFIFGGITFYIAIHMSASTRNLMLLLYSLGVLLVAYECYSMVVRGRQFFLEVADDYSNRKDNLFLFSKGRDSDERSILSYLLLPRLESIPKSLLAVVMFTVAASTTGAWQWHRFLLLWLILEYLVYAARYQWNDLRDFGSDQIHPARDLRGRLPAGTGSHDTSHHVVLSVTVLAIRLGLAVFIGIETDTLAQAGLIVGTVFCIAICYEVLRVRLSDSRAPASKPGTRFAVAVWLAVGPGYAVRGAVGLLSAHVRWTDPALYIGLAGLMALGITVVLMSWLLDVSSFFSVGPDGTWHIKSTHSAARAYTWVLLRYASVPVQAGKEASKGPVRLGAETEGRREKLLKHKQAGWAPWNIAYALTAILICEFATSLPGGRPAPAAAYYVTAAVSAVGTVLMIYSNEQWKRWLVTVSFTGFTLLASGASSSPHWLLVGVGWLVVAVCYTSLCGMSFLDLVQALPRLRKGLIKAGSAAGEMALGSTAFQYLRPSSRAPGPAAEASGRAHSNRTRSTGRANVRKPVSTKGQAGGS